MSPLLPPLHDSTVYILVFFLFIALEYLIPLLLPSSSSLLILPSCHFDLYSSCRILFLSFFFLIPCFPSHFSSSHSTLFYVCTRSYGWKSAASGISRNSIRLLSLSSKTNTNTHIHTFSFDGEEAREDSMFVSGFVSFVYQIKHKAVQTLSRRKASQFLERDCFMYMSDHRHHERTGASDLLIVHPLLFPPACLSVSAVKMLSG
jgi:hypothetical protein